MGWLANNLAPHYVRATGTGAQIMLANCMSCLLLKKGWTEILMRFTGAAFIATFTYLTEDA